MLGVTEDGKLRWAGNVGTGFDQKTLAAVHARLKPLVTAQVPVRRTRPSPRPRHHLGEARAGLPGEVRQLDRDRRLRAPVFLGLRNDKPAAEVERETLRRGDRAELLPAGRQRSHARDRRPRL